MKTERLTWDESKWPSNMRKPVSVIYTENENEIRIISLRKTTRSEEKILTRDLPD